MFVLSLLISVIPFSLALNCQSVFSLDSQAQMPAVNYHHSNLPLNFDYELFPEHLAARMFVEMADRNMLLHQADEQLGQRGLLPPNHGLCASTCATNLIGAVTAQYHNFVEFPQKAPDILQRVVDAYTQINQRDARLGARVDLLADVVLSIFYDLAQINGYDNSITEIQLSRSQHIHEQLYAHRIFTAMRGDSIGIGSVRAIDPEAFGSSVGHAIIILKVDTANRHLYISDPNAPNQILRVPYQFTQGTDIAFAVPFTFGEHRVAFYQFTAFQRRLMDRH
jgi:hypothetical protein